MRNQKKRDEIQKQINALKEAWDKEAATADLIVDDEEWAKEDKRLFDFYQPQIDKLYKRKDLLQYPHPRDKWFCETFIPSIGKGTHHISEYQRQIIEGHCGRAYPSDFPRCVVGNMLVTLTRKGVCIGEVNA